MIWIYAGRSYSELLAVGCMSIAKDMLIYVDIQQSRKAWPIDYPLQP